MRMKTNEMDSPRFLLNRGVRVLNEDEAKSFSATQVLRAEVVVCTQKYVATTDPTVEKDRFHASC